MASNETEADSGTEETLLLYTDDMKVSQWEMKQKELCVFVDRVGSHVSSAQDYTAKHKCLWKHSSLL